MIKKYLLSIKNDFPQIGNEELFFFKNGLTITKLEAKSFYIKANEVQKNIGFVAKGLFRCFYLKEDGIDITYSFAKEGDYITHYSNFLNQEPSRYFFQCTEPSTIINIPLTHIMACFDKYPSLASCLSLSIGKDFTNQLERIKGFLFEDAETRYLNFIGSNQDLLHRVSLSHLSSYLGIERHVLTRIRKKFLQP